jgi:hypothetical protein
MGDRGEGRVATGANACQRIDHAGGHGLQTGPLTSVEP